MNVHGIESPLNKFAFRKLVCDFTLHATLKIFTAIYYICVFPC